MSIMKYTIRRAKSEDVAGIVLLVKEQGLAVCESDLRLFFFEMPDGSENIGGVLAEADNGEIVGYLGVSRCDLIIEGQTCKGYIRGVLAVRPNGGMCAFDLCDAASAMCKDGVSFSNTANSLSVKLGCGYAGFEQGPESGNYMFFSCLPLGALFGLLPIKRKMESFDDCGELYDNLGKFRSKLCSSRSVERMKWLFDDKIRNGDVSIVKIDDQNQVVGCGIMKRRRVGRLPIFRYQILDICVKDDSESLAIRLLNRMKYVAMINGACLLEINASGKALVSAVKKSFAYSRKIASNPFVWTSNCEKITSVICADKGWFWGPYDGDRITCM